MAKVCLKCWRGIPEYQKLDLSYPTLTHRVVLVFGVELCRGCLMDVRSSLNYLQWLLDGGNCEIRAIQGAAQKADNQLGFSPGESGGGKPPATERPGRLRQRAEKASETSGG